jgi:prepilin-type N-terminal cleavage/methylation domain-containing protein
MNKIPLAMKNRIRAFTLIELLTVIVVIGILAAIMIPVAGKVRMTARRAHSLSNLKQAGASVHLFLSDNRQRFPVLRSNDWSIFWVDALVPYIGKRNEWRQNWPVAPGYTTSWAPPVLLDPALPSGVYHGAVSDYAANDYLFSVLPPDAPAGNLTGTVSITDVRNPGGVVLLVTSENVSGNVRIGCWNLDHASYVEGANIDALWAPSDHGTGIIMAVFADGHTKQIPKQTFFDNRRSLLMADP